MIDCRMFDKRMFETLHRVWGCCSMVAARIDESPSLWLVMASWQARFGIGDVYFCAISWGKLDTCPLPVCCRSKMKAVLTCDEFRGIDMSMFLLILFYMDRLVILTWVLYEMIPDDLPFGTNISTHIPPTGKETHLPNCLLDGVC